MKATLLALAAIVLAPFAAADVTHSTTFTGGAIPYDGTATVPIQVSVGCEVILASLGGSASVAVVGPAWLNATSTTVSFEPSECAGIPSGSEVPKITKQADVTLTPAPESPGLVNATLNATIVYVGEAPMSEPRNSFVDLPAVHVAYRPGHVLTPSGDQTFSVTNGSYSFDMTIDITANARTMIMFEDKKVTGGALLTGLQAHTFNVPEGEVSKVNPVKFTAPQGAWDTVRVTFYNYSHCLDGTDCGPQVQSNITWTFKNANPGAAVEPAGEDEKKGSKGAPGPAMPAILIALAVVAIAARRKLM